MWRNRQGEFAHATDEATLSKYSHIYPKYLPLVLAGRSLEEISIKINERHPESKLSNADWSVLFSDWLRTTQSSKVQPPKVTEEKAAEKEITNKEVEVAVAGPFYVKGSDIAFNTQGQADRFAAKVRIARIFKDNFDSWDFGSPEVGRRAHVVVSLITEHNY